MNGAALPFPYTMARLRANEIDSVLTIWPEPTPPEQTHIEDVKDLVRQALSLVPLLRRGWNETLDMIVKETVDLARLGQSVADLLRQCSRVMKGVVRTAEAVMNEYGETAPGVDD